MKYRIPGICALVLVLLLPDAAQAHRVNVFAYVDGDAVQVECSFSKKQKVRNGKLVITDGETGASVLEAVTDNRGMFRFRPADDFLQTGHGMEIRLLAGEGHQDVWRVSREELRALAPSGTGGAQAPPLEQEHTPPPPQTARPDEKAAAPALPPLDHAALEVLVGNVMDAKLAPIKLALARQEERGPGLNDIVGGIGWIIGLLGLATYMKYRR